MCPSSLPPCVQVCSYQCIVSYESPRFSEFSLCIIQKHNCLGLSADIPMVSSVAWG